MAWNHTAGADGSGGRSFRPSPTRWRCSRNTGRVRAANARPGSAHSVGSGTPAAIAAGPGTPDSAPRSESGLQTPARFSGSPRPHHQVTRRSNLSKVDMPLKGKYPPFGAASGNKATNELQWILGRTAAGTLRNEFEMPQLTIFPTATAWFDLNQTQFSAATAYLEGAPGRFSLSANCSDWAFQGVRTIGVGAPSNLTTFGFTDPSKIVDWTGGGN